MTSQYRNLAHSMPSIFARQDGLEDEYVYAAQALPTPADTPYRTPSRSVSRRSSQHGDLSPSPSSSPPPLPPSHGRHASKDEENISMLDPRRFTPTLHANLVAEILSLRRDLDTKNGFVENLEGNLQRTRAEYDSLNATYNNNAKETRSLRRQLQLLEGGTSSALGELARERDEAVDNVAENRRRVEVLQKKVRTQEENADRVQDLWEKDKENWENEKRILDRKVHVVEGRLKAILEEVAQQQAAALAFSQQQSIGETEEAPKENGLGHESDTASVRSMSARGFRPMSAMSNDDYHGNRVSMLSGPNGYGGTALTGLSLAEELEMDEEDEDEDLVDETEMAPEPAQGATKADKDHSAALETLTSHQPPDAEKSRESRSRDVVYIDSGIQFSPPQSPKYPPPPPDFMRVDKAHERPISPTDNEANQRRKRVSLGLSHSHGQTPLPAIVVPSPAMVSASSQTLESPLSPPRTPKSPVRPQVASPVVAHMRSCGSQTENVVGQKETQTGKSPPVPLAVPSIAIHPPTSAALDPGEARLPPQTRSIATQASLNAKAKVRSISMQTEEIRIDKRLIKLPANLLPSAISSSPVQPKSPPAPSHPPPPPPTKSSKRRTSDRFVDELPSSPPSIPDFYSNSNDATTSKGSKHTSIKRPFRASNLFAGFELPSSDDGDDFDETELSDNDYRTALSAPKPWSKMQKQARSTSDTPSVVAEDTEPGDSNSSVPDVDKKSSTATTSKIRGNRSSSGSGKPEKSPKTRQLEKAPNLTSGKPPNIRKSALISSGTAAHSRVRSPSLSDQGGVFRRDPTPPFPVPTRSSSRRIPMSASDGTRSPTRYSGSMSSAGRRRYAGPPPRKQDSLRKVRSAAAIPRMQRRAGERHRSRSPPPLSESSPVPESPRLPPMPKNELTSPYLNRDAQRFRHRPQPSSNTSGTGGTSVRSSLYQTNVVDAISQTMVGEWMWKYVRRRKSFGVPDSPQGIEGGKTGEDSALNITGNGVRHKRWAWLAPYERAVMWSSKQPTSGSALMGKTGRKLIIQSVLDVKDDTPIPKGSAPGTIFNRSILILTPARALKFTATTKERHYVWLTALSFLAHSSGGANDMVSLPPVPQQEFENPSRQEVSAVLRRHPIRDSIRVAKGKTGPVGTNGTLHSPQPEEAEAGVTKEYDGGLGVEALIPDAADPPNVPRFSSHGRKRSNTGPRAPPGGFRSFSHQTMPSSNHSFVTNGSSDLYASSVRGYTGMHSGQTSISGRTSDASGPFPPQNNFFDAVGTMRMEAFIHQTPPSAFDEHQRGNMGLGIRSKAERKRHDGGHWGGHSSNGSSRVGGHEEYDPFRGF